jgi:hypothetical protein
MHAVSRNARAEAARAAGFRNISARANTLSATVRAILAASALVLLLAAPAALAQQTETPRPRPQGPAAGPIIKLPRGAGADVEQTPPVESERATSLAPRRWEYCAITGFNWKQKGFSLSSPSAPSAVIRFFPNTFEEVEGVNEEDALANAFARLGAEGWELTAIRQSLVLREGDGKSTHTFYFKRPAREE